MTLKLDLRNAISVLELAPNFKLSLIFNHLTTSGQVKVGPTASQT